jgi:hypothetical protein
LTPKEKIAIFGAAVIMLYLWWYTIAIWTGKRKTQNPASWLMWFILDCLLLVVTFLGGKPIWLPLAYAAGCGPVMVVNFFRGKLVWSWWREGLALGAASVATYIWLSSGADWGIISGAAAMTIAGIPLYVNLAKKPDRSSFWMWFLTAFACVCTAIGSDWSVTGLALAVGSFAYNSTLSVVVLRRVK